MEAFGYIVGVSLTLSIVVGIISCQTKVDIAEQASKGKIVLFGKHYKTIPLEVEYREVKGGERE